MQNENNPLDPEIFRQEILLFAAQNPHSIRILTKGQRIIEQGEISDECYLITEGTLSVLAREDADRPEKEIAVRSGGALIGEMAVLQRNRPRTASVEVVSSAATVISLRRDDLITMMGRNPALHNWPQFLTQLVEPRQEETARIFRAELTVTNQIMTVLMADIHGFSRLSDQVWEEQSSTFLSDLLDEIGHTFTTRETSSWEDQGDGVKAYFSGDKHVDRALQCAIDIQRIFFELRERWKKTNEAFRRIGIGIGIVTDIMSVRSKQINPTGSVRVLSHAINLAAAISRYRRRATESEIYIDSTSYNLLTIHRELVRPSRKRWLDKIDRFYDLHRVQTALSAPPTQQEENPYIVGAPIKDRDRFFGRKEEFEHILGSVVNNHFIISGERRIGKTSLLHQISESLRANAETRIGYRIWTANLSLQGVTAEVFYERLMGAIVNQIKPPSFLRLHYPRLAYGDFAFEEDLLIVTSWLQDEAKPRKARLVLCLDELDALLTYPNRYREQLRAIIQSIDPIVRIVAAGVVVIEQEALRTSPFYNQFTRIELKPLSPQEVERIARQPTADAITFTDEAIKLIIERSHGLPLTVQRLCYYSLNIALQHSLDIIGTPEVALAFDQTLADQSAEFEQIWWGSQFSGITSQEGLNRDQRALLRDAAEHHNGLLPNHAFEGSNALFARRSLDNITYKTAEGVRLTSLFSAWVRKMPADL